MCGNVKNADIDLVMPIFIHTLDVGLHLVIGRIIGWWKNELQTVVELYGFTVCEVSVLFATSL